MRLTEAQLKTIIKEELAKTLKEVNVFGLKFGAHNPSNARKNVEAILPKISFKQDPEFDSKNSIRARNGSMIIDFYFQDKDDRVGYRIYKGTQEVSSGEILYTDLASKQVPEELSQKLERIASNAGRSELAAKNAEDANKPSKRKDPFLAWAENPSQRSVDYDQIAREKQDAQASRNFWADRGARAEERATQKWGE